MYMRDFFQSFQTDMTLKKKLCINDLHLCAYQECPNKKISIFVPEELLHLSSQRSTSNYNHLQSTKKKFYTIKLNDVIHSIVGIQIHTNLGVFYN